MGSYVISDIHGCYDELIRMLEKINLVPYLYETKVSGRTCIIVHAGYIRRLDTPELKAMYSSKGRVLYECQG